MSGQVCFYMRQGLFALWFALCVFLSGVVSADSIDAKTVKTMVKGWLNYSPGHLDKSLLDRTIKAVKAVKDGQDDALLCGLLGSGRLHRSFSQRRGYASDRLFRQRQVRQFPK